ITQPSFHLSAFTHPMVLVYTSSKVIACYWGLIPSFVKSRKKFDGQLFPIYLMLYSVGRSIIEEFRGDEARGFIMDGWLSHSQFISIFIFGGAAFMYYLLNKKSKTNTSAKA
ncbi:MAG: prolipoprotein diacylglyceryl transferase family protein, partial [Bacteroidia bacterium]